MRYSGGSRALLVIVATSLLRWTLYVTPAAAATPDSWWNANWAYRHQLELATVDGTPAGYSVSVKIPHAAYVQAGASLSNGDDVRVLRLVGAVWTEISRVVDVDSSWNSPDTTLWFRTSEAIGANLVDRSYWITYGNPTAGAPPANANDVFDLWDDFGGASLDTSKWSNVDASMPVMQVNGELVLSATTTASNQWNSGGIGSIDSFAPGFRVDSSFRIVDQSVVTQQNWKSTYGVTDNVASVFSQGDPDKLLGYWNGAQWEQIGDSSLDARTFGQQRVAVSSDASGMARVWENGVLKATSLTAPVWAQNVYMLYSPNGADETFDVRWDDVTVRKYVEVEPTVSLSFGESGDAHRALEVALEIPPALTFEVIGTPAGTDCNSAAATVSTGAKTVTLAATSPATLQTSVQHLRVGTNAAYGYVVTARSTGQLAGVVGDIDDWTGSNAQPTTWTAPGVEGFGYTTGSASLSGTSDRFLGGKWAAFTVSAAEVARSSTPVVDVTCFGYRVGTSAGTRAGEYNTTVVLTAVASF